MKNYNKIIIMNSILLSLAAHASYNTDSVTISHNAIERYSIDIVDLTASPLIEELDIDYSYSEWEEYGEPFNCEFIPPASTVLKGEVFSQTEACVQLQMRYKYTYKRGVLSSTEEEFRYGDAERTQDAVGILTFSTQYEYTDWVYTGVQTGCYYTPSTSSKLKGTSFTQNYRCSMKYTRQQNTYRVNDITGDKTLTATLTQNKSSYTTVSSATAIGTGMPKWRSGGGSIFSTSNHFSGTVNNIRQSGSDLSNLECAISQITSHSNWQYYHLKSGAKPYNQYFEGKYYNYIYDAEFYYCYF